MADVKRADEAARVAEANRRAALESLLQHSSVAGSDSEPGDDEVQGGPVGPVNGSESPEGGAAGGAP